MEKKDLICIVCPMGCMMEVEIDAGKVIEISGNTCPRGEAYARKEVTSPTRVVTTSVKLKGRSKGQISCKTRNDIPKEKIFDVVRQLKEVEAIPPIHIGDVILKNAAETGVDVIATVNVE
ncbi:MAG: DUF1667 domain-containing protein [Lachnospiraceae bacterium]